MPRGNSVRQADGNSIFQLQVPAPVADEERGAHPRAQLGNLFQRRVDFRRPALCSVIDDKQKIGVPAIDIIRDHVAGLIDDRDEVAALPERIGHPLSILIWSVLG